MTIQNNELKIKVFNSGKVKLQWCKIEYASNLKHKKFHIVKVLFGRKVVKRRENGIGSLFEIIDLFLND